MNEKINFICYKNKTENFKSLIRRSTLITGPIKLPNNIIKNPNTKKQLVISKDLVKDLKIKRSSLFGIPLHTDVLNLDKISFSIVYMGEYDSTQLYFLGNVISINKKYYLNLVFKNYLRNPITDTYAWMPFYFDQEIINPETPPKKKKLYGLLNDWTKLK